MREKYPVIIVGAGSVGLTLALELSNRGIPCLILEKRESTSTQPKCNLVNARSMEHMRRLGLEEEFRKQGIPSNYSTSIKFLTSLGGKKITEFKFPSFNEAVEQKKITAFGCKKATTLPQRISQIYTERILRQKVDKESVLNILFNCEVTGFNEVDSSIEVTFFDKKRLEEKRVKGSYLVGCDGASSFVRNHLNIKMDGAKSIKSMLGIQFHAPNLRYAHKNGDAIMYFIANPRTKGVLIPYDPKKDLWVYQTPLQKESFTASVKVEVAKKVLTEAIGFDIKYKILEVNKWDTSLMVARRYKKDRAFLVGDAVHLFTPTGGLGMNTGVEDAINLGWKLALVLQKKADPKILETYELERRPIGMLGVRESGDNAKKLLKVSKGLKVIEQKGVLGWVTRKIAGNIIRKKTYKEFHSEDMQLGFSYIKSPICISDSISDREESSFSETNRVGSRAPNKWLSIGKNLHDILGKEYTLLKVYGDEVDTKPFEETAKKRGLKFKILSLNESILQKVYLTKLTLIRPDQFIAWRSDQAPNNPDELLDKLQGKTINVNHSSQPQKDIFIAESNY